MENMKNKIKNFLKENKGFTLSILFIVLLLCYVAIPTLSDYNNTTSTYTITAWDGTTAESYSGGTGAEDDPYIISNGSELLYFASQLNTNDYEGEYFILKNDIVLNDGIFSYTEDGEIKYKKNDIENIITPNSENSIINVFQHLDGFKGNIDGDFHTIYGLYIDESLDEQNGLFTNLEGNISNLYVKNSMIYGGTIVGGIASMAVNSVFTNVTYDGFVISDDVDSSNAAGIVSVADNTSLKNVINKAYIYALVDAAGIVNVIDGKTSLTNVYNTGIIESDDASSGLISTINQNNDDVTIINCYNNGTLKSTNNAMIGDIENNTGSITLTNVFNTQDEYVINFINDSEVYVKNSYIISDKSVKSGVVDGLFVQTTFDELNKKSFIQTNLGYEEYVGSENIVDDVWVWLFDEDSLPILYIDELNRPIANIYIKEYVWDNYGDEIETFKFSDNLVFSIEEVSILNPIKEVYYYISNEKIVLTKDELDAINNWENYENIVEINDEGFYIIYAKIIDNSNNVIYVNTDLLVLDLTGAEIKITSSFTDSVWKTFETNVNTIYVNNKIDIDIQAEDSLSGVSKIYYYLSDVILSIEEVENIEEWIEYTELVSIDSGKTILYVKVLDNCDYVTYANTDLIIMNGYVLNSLSPGMNGNSIEDLYISENSSVSLNFIYEDDNEYAIDGKHLLVSNVLLPQNTKITIIDKIKNKVYVYITTDDDYGYSDCVDDVCEAKYEFELFNEVGSTSLFKESDYTGKINENFVVLVDFIDADVNENINNISLKLKIDNANTNEIRDTLVYSYKEFNIYKDSNASFSLSSSFDDTINYNENYQYIIDFSTKLNYKTLGDNIIFDTTFDDKNLGLSIKMVDSNGNIVDRKNLKNIVFKFGDKKYSPLNDGIVKINLNNGISDITDNLIIQTYSDNYDLESGNYKFVITLYAAYDGVYSNENLSNIEIPVYVGENVYNSDTSFNVLMDDEDKIVMSKENEFDFEFLVSDITDNTTIKMSLYGKNSLSPYDQKYTIMDLGDYIINNNLEMAAENIYYASKKLDENNKLNINLNTNLLDNNGYMFVFELYDGEKLVSKINRKFIVK